jgi:PAS domain S-box-containing protein
MRDENKTKGQLIDEMVQLRQRVAELEEVGSAQQPADQALREWQTTSDAMSDWVCLIDPASHQVLRSNRAGEEILGLRLAEIVGQNCCRLLHGSDQPLPECPVRESVSTRQPAALEIEVPQSDRCFLITVHPIVDDRGEVVAVVHVARDITRRKRAEDVLAEERDRAQGYLDVAGVMLVAIDADQAVTLVSQKGCEILGYEEHEIIGRNWFDTFLPERLRDGVRAVFAELLAGGSESVEYFENPILTNAGEERIIAWHNTVLVDSTGKISGILSSGEDITKRRRAERELEQRTEDLQLINALNDAVNRGAGLPTVIELLSSELQRTLPCNGATLYLLSDDKEYLVIQNLTLRPSTAARIEKLIGGTIPEVRIRLKEGSLYRRLLDDGHAQIINDAETIKTLMAECTENTLLKKLVEKAYRFLDIHSVVAVPLLEDGKAAGLLGVSRSEPFSEADVARLESMVPQLIGCLQRKRSGDALRESEARFRHLSEAAFEAIVIHDSGVVIAANDQFWRMFGFQPDELTGKQSIPLTVAPEASEAMREQIAAGGKGPYESTGLRKDGTRFPMEIRARQMNYQGREVRVATAVDLTERKSAEDLQSTQRDLALALSAAIGLEETLPLCLDTAMKVSGLDCGGVYLVEEASGALNLAADKGLSAEFVQAVCHYEADSANARLVMAGNPVYTPYQELAVSLSEAERREGLRSIAVIPVRHEGRVIACINVASHALQEVPAFLRPVLEATAAQMANAIARSRAEEAIRQRNEELLALNAIAEALSSSLDLKEILDSALNKALEIVGVEAGGVYLVDETSRRLTLKAHHGVSEEFVSQIGEVAVDEEAIARATEMGMAGKLIVGTELLLKDRTLLKRVTTAIAREKLRSYRQVIIRSKGTPAGLLVVATHDSRKFTPQEEQLLSTIAHQMGLAAENVSLYEEQVNKVFQMDALRKTALDITSELDLNTVLGSIAARAVQLLRGTGGGLYLYRPEADLLEGVISVGGALAPPGSTLQRGEGLSGKVWETGQPLSVDDYTHWEGRSRRYEAYDYEAAVGVPVYWQNKFLGVLNILADAPRTFGRNDAELLSLFASQAAIAIENARLFDQTRKRAEEQVILNRVTTATASTLELPDVLQAVATEMAGAFGVEQCGLALLDDANQQLTVVAEYLAPGRTSALGDVIPVRGNPSTERVLETGRALAISDAQDDPLLAPVRHLLEKRGTKSLLIVPLPVKGKVMGTIGVDFVDTIHKFTPEEIALAESIAGQAAVAIENARLYEAAKDRIAELTVLAEIGLQINRSLDSAEVLDMVATGVLRLFHASDAHIFLYDRENDELSFAAGAWAEPDKSHSAYRAPRKDGLTAQVARSGRPLLVNDTRSHPLFADYEEWRADMEAIGGFPLRAHDEVIGVFNIAFDSRHTFDEHELRLAGLLADQSAIAIENAHLYAEQVNKVFQMDALRKTTLDITSQLDLDVVLHSIASRAIELLNSTAGGLYLYRPEQDVLEWAVAIGDGLAPVGTMLRPGEGLAGKVWETAQSLVVDDYRHWEGRAAVYDAYPLTAVVGAPVCWGATVLGVLCVNAYTPRAFSQADAELLSLLASQAAIAIENASLFAKQERKAREMSALYEISLDISGRLALTDVLRSIMNRAVELLHTSGGAVWLYQREEDHLKLAISYGHREGFVGGSMKPSEGLSGKVFATGQPMTVEDYRCWDGRSQKFDSDIIGGMLGVPLMWGQQAIGVLIVHEIEKRRMFTEDEIRLLSLLANQAAIAIENATLHEKVRSRSRYLETLQEINATLRSTLPVREVLDTIVRGAAEAFGYEGTLIVVPSETGERLVFAAVSRGKLVDAALKLTGSSLESFSLPMEYGENPMAKALLTGELQTWSGEPARIVAGVEPRISPEIARAIARLMNAHSAACVPLQAGEKTVGVLVAMSPRGRFSDDELSMLLGLASQAGLAIQNASLYEETQRRAEELKTLYDVSLDLVGQLDLPILLRTITDRATELLGRFAAGLYLYDFHREELELVAAKGLWEDRIGVRLALGEGVCGKVAQTGEPLMVEDYANWEGVSPQFVGEQTFNALAVPIRQGETLLGALYFDSPDLESVFAEIDVRLATLFANQAAIAIENARLYAEQERRATVMTALYETSLDISRHLVLIDVLRSIVNRSVELLYTGGGAVWLYRPDEDQLELVADYGQQESYVGGRMKIGEGVSGKVFATGQAMAVEDYRHWEGRSEEFDSDTIGGMLGVPLMWSQQVIGVLNVNEIEIPRRFTEEETRLLTLFANQAAIAIQNARLHEQKEVAAREMTALYDTALDISGRLELPDVLRSIMIRAVQLLHTAGGAVWLYCLGEDELELAVDYGPPETYVGTRMKVGDGVVGKVLASRQAMAVEDYRQWEGRWGQFDSDIIGGILGVPLVWSEQAIGVLCINEAEKPRKFTEQEIRLLSLFANQAAVAIQNARLHEQQEVTAREMTALYDTALDISGRLELPDVLRSIMIRGVELLGASGAAIWLYQPEDEELEFIIEHGGLGIHVGERVPLGEGLAGKVLQTGGAVVVEDYRQWDGRLPQLDSGTVGGMVGVPLLWGEQAIGILEVYEGKKPRHFTEADVRLLTLFGNQAAVAIQNARLHEQALHREAQLAALHDVSLEIASELDLTVLLRTVAQRAIDLLGGAKGGLYLYRPERQELEMVVHLGSEHDYLGSVLRLGEGVCGRVAQTGQPLVVVDHAHWEGRSVKFEDAGDFNMLAVPIKHGDSLLGALYIDDPDLDRRFDEPDIRLATMFANQAAITIENARLHQEQQQRAQELTALHETALDITRHLDLDTLLKAIIARATSLLDAPSGDVYLYRPDSDDLQNVASLGMPPELQGKVLKPDEGLTGRVFKAGEPLAVDDYEAWDGRSEQYVGYGFSRALAAPLRYGRRSVGVLVIDRPADSPAFTESDAKLLTLFANQAAIAIENARLLSAVATHEENLRGLSSRLIDAQEQERKRIAQELHDEMGQALTAISINLSAIDKGLGAALDPETAERLAETDSLITRTLEQMRDLALDLRPSMLDDLGLLPALRWYIKRYENRTGIQVGLEVSDLEERLPEPIATVIYRVVQEALTNVTRHAGASRVDIHLQQRDSVVQAFIEDNGSGFDLAEVADREAEKRGVGLVGMQERVAVVGGSLEIKSRRGKGTRLAIQLPLP